MSTVFISDGVPMEAEWVLCSHYRWRRERINMALTELLSLEDVLVRDEAALSWSLERHCMGTDSADMLHIVASRGADAILTFEAKMPQRAGAETPTPVELLQ